MSNAATKEIARILVVTSLEAVAKRFGVTVRQVLDQIMEDVQSGTQSGASVALSKCMSEGRNQIKNGDVYEMLRLCAE